MSRKSKKNSRLGYLPVQVHDYDGDHVNHDDDDSLTIIRMMRIVKL